MHPLVEKLRSGSELDPSEIEKAADSLLDPGIEDAAKAAFLIALSDKGETPDEIAGLVQAFLQHAHRPEIDATSLPGPMIDVCGTGGDQLHLFNVSTTAAFLLAAAGATVVKHGNRGITSKSGGADVLEALGIPIDLPPERVEPCLRKCGIAFLFAPLYHPAFKAVAPVRKQLAAQGRRSVFNLLGPLLNPLQPPHQLIGVFNPALPPVFAQILHRLGRTSAWVVHGETADGRSMDELSTLGPTRICRFEKGVVFAPETLLATEYGLATPTLEDLAGGDAAHNAALLEAILDGSAAGPKTDLAVWNAAAGLVVAGLAPNLEAGIERARETIQNGSALQTLRDLQSFHFR